MVAGTKKPETKKAEKPPLPGLNKINAKEKVGTGAKVRGVDKTIVKTKLRENLTQKPKPTAFYAPRVPPAQDRKKKSLERELRRLADHLVGPPVQCSKLELRCPFDRNGVPSGTQSLEVARNLERHCFKAPPPASSSQQKQHPAASSSTTTTTCEQQHQPAAASSTTSQQPAAAPVSITVHPNSNGTISIAELTRALGKAGIEILENLKEIRKPQSEDLQIVTQGQSGLELANNPAFINRWKMAPSASPPVQRPQ